MASLPPRRECCTTGSIHTGSPRGEITTLAGVETYLSRPAGVETTKAILLLSDVIGHRLTNTQLLADEFAQHGYLAVVPDIFDGDAVPEILPEGYAPFEEWVLKHGPDTTDPIVETVLKELRSGLGCTKIGAAGYCFGAKYVIRHLRTGEQKIDVGYIVHPTNVEVKELEDIAGPLCIDAAENDPVFPQERRHKSEDILARTGHPYMISLFGKVEHGFAVRANLAMKPIKYARDLSMLHALHWFEEHL